MIVLRQEQVEALRQVQLRSFLERMARYLREKFPAVAREPEGELTARVAVQAQRAEGYGLHTEKQVSQFVIAAWLQGPDFDTRHAEVQQVLLRSDRKPMQKAAWIEDWARKHP